MSMSKMRPMTTSATYGGSYHPSLKSPKRPRAERKYVASCISAGTDPSIPLDDLTSVDAVKE